VGDDSDARRDELHAFLQQQGPPREDEDVPEGAAVLTGWVVVAEWMDEDGTRWLSRGWSASKAKWEADGMIHEVLYGKWDDG
jgi:hypothetical protein